MGVAGDEIQDRLHIPGCERVMAPTFLDNDRDLAGEFLVSFLGHARLGLERWVEAAANVQERHAGLGQGAELSSRDLRHDEGPAVVPSAELIGWGPELSDETLSLGIESNPRAQRGRGVAKLNTVLAQILAAAIERIR